MAKGKYTPYVTGIGHSLSGGYWNKRIKSVSATDQPLAQNNIYLKSPNGTVYLVTVADDGTLDTTEV